MAYQSSNPVFTNRNYAPSAGELNQLYAAPSRLTVDDVVVHTAIQLGVLAVGAAVGWGVTAAGNLSLALPAGLVALALSWLVAPRLVRSGRFGASFALPFAIVEGFFVGSISKVYDQRFHGIVGQALLGTGVIFGLMLVLHRTGVLRGTPRMARIVTGALGGVVLLFLVDLVINLFGGSLAIVDGSGPLSILLTLGILVIASLTFTIDFYFIEQAVAESAPSKLAWYFGWSLMLSFVLVYLQLLRLLSQFRR